MFFRFSVTALALVATLGFSSSTSFAGPQPPTVKVLAQEEGGFNVSSIRQLIKKGDQFASRGKLVKARENYDQARTVSKQLLSFYRDLAGSFRGLDARIPREMDSRGRETLTLLAQTNLRLAALFRRQDKPEVAVPLLVEVVRLLSPTSSDGQKAYQNLVELGFVETPYLGAR